MFRPSLLLLSLGVLAEARPAHAFEHHHALGTGYDYQHVAAASGGRYNFHSLPLTYRGRFGGELAGAFRLGLVLPLLAHQSDAFFPGSEYASYGGLDLALGPTYRLPLRSAWSVDAGAGFHFGYLRLTSDEYVEWSSATAGFGFSGSARRTLDGRFLGGRPELGVHADLDFDVADFSRGGDLQVGVHAALGISIGLGYGGAK